MQMKIQYLNRCGLMQNWLNCFLNVQHQNRENICKIYQNTKNQVIQSALNHNYKILKIAWWLFKCQKKKRSFWNSLAKKQEQKIWKSICNSWKLIKNRGKHHFISTLNMTRKNLLLLKSHLKNLNNLVLSLLCYFQIGWKKVLKLKSL